MQAYIALNPNSKDPMKMIKAFQKEAEGEDYTLDPNAKPEPGAFDMMKRALNRKPKP